MANRLRCSGILAAIAALTTAGQASAAEWWLVSESSDEITFADRATVRSINVRGTPVRSAWLWAFEKTGETYLQKSKDLYLFDCINQSSALGAAREYNPNGELKHSYEFEEYELIYRFTTTGTAGESRLRFVCNSEKGSGEITEFSVSDDNFYYVREPEEFIMFLAKELTR